MKSFAFIFLIFFLSYNQNQNETAKKPQLLLIIQIKMLFKYYPMVFFKRDNRQYLFILIQQLFMVPTIYLHNAGGGTQILLLCHFFHHSEGICVYLLTNFLNFEITIDTQEVAKLNRKILCTPHLVSPSRIPY